MKWLRDIVRSGLSPNDEYQKKRGILLTNYVSLVLAGSIILLYITRRLVFGHIPGGLTTYLVFVGLVAFGGPILVNRFGLTTLSRLLMCYSPVVFVWYGYISLMKVMPVVEQVNYDSLRIHLLALSFLPYILLDRRETGWLALGILPTLFSILFTDFILSQFEIGSSQRGVPGLDTPLIGIRTFVAYCIISVSCFIFQSIISYNDDLNKKILSQLAEKSEEIKAQNEELLRSQKQLNDINQNLENLVAQKTESIKQQNEKILSYAYTNAHHVRGSVARLLGLIQVSRLETDLDYPWFFEKIEDETKKADEIITNIANELNEINHDRPAPATLIIKPDDVGAI